ERNQSAPRPTQARHLQRVLSCGWPPEERHRDEADRSLSATAARNSLCDDFIGGLVTGPKEDLLRPCRAGRMRYLYYRRAVELGHSCCGSKRTFSFPSFVIPSENASPARTEGSLALFLQS